jgi:hypothetical protein
LLEKFFREAADPVDLRLVLFAVDDLAEGLYFHSCWFDGEFLIIVLAVGLSALFLVLVDFEGGVYYFEELLNIVLFLTPF